jgi:hypothetical protein
LTMKFIQQRVFIILIYIRNQKIRNRQGLN